MTENRFCFLDLCYISASVIFTLNPASVELSAVRAKSHLPAPIGAVIS